MHDASIGSGLQCKLTATASGRDLKVTVTGYAYVPGRAIIQFTTTDHCQAAITPLAQESRTCSL
jgi:hypothetical protein